MCGKMWGDHMKFWKGVAVWFKNYKINNWKSARKAKVYTVLHLNIKKACKNWEESIA